MKQFNNKSSVLKKHTRYTHGGETTVLTKRLGWWERDISLLEKNTSDITLTISKRYANRPDLISYDYYGTPKLFWIILMYNSIVDAKEELKEGSEIQIPSKARVNYEFLS